MKLSHIEEKYVNAGELPVSVKVKRFSWPYNKFLVFNTGREMWTYGTGRPYDGAWNEVEDFEILKD